MVRDKEAYGRRGQDLCRSRATSSEMSGFIWRSDLRVVRKRTAMADKASFSRASYLSQSLSHDVLPCARQAEAAAKCNRLFYFCNLQYARPRDGLPLIVAHLLHALTSVSNTYPLASEGRRGLGRPPHMQGVSTAVVVRLHEPGGT
jgi:hypothetical protein